MKKTIFFAAFTLSALAYSQVGVNTQSPASTFDVSIKRDGSGNISDNSLKHGLQAPRLTRTELLANTPIYTSDQNGALIYISDISGAAPAAGTQKESVMATGYYYFDASAASGAGRWIKVASGIVQTGYTAINGLNMTASNVVKLGGAITEPTTISAVSAANKLAVTGTGVDAVDIGSGIFSVDADNKRIGINNTAPVGLLHIKSIGAGNQTDSSIFGINNCGDPCGQGTARNVVLYNANAGNSDFASVNFVASADPTQPTAASISGIDRDAVNSYAGLSFNTRDASGLSSKMVVKSNGKVGIGTTTPNASAILDVSSTTAGFLMSRMSTSQMNAITSPATGLQVYNTDENCLFTYNGSNWRSQCTRTFQQSSAGVSQIARGTSTDLSQTITLAGTQNITVQVSFNPQAWTNTSNGYAFGTYSILIDGVSSTGGMRYATQNAGSNLYRYSSTGTWTTTLAPGSHTIIFRVTSDTAANGATVDTNAEDRRMIVTVN
ncbi:hypothetical protein [uncultured Chryseobacterium sp.]|uniref:hypothetical protein n=1 Tax=uncultured Chryseobacterium sp. TaxID=259322 RepID=UPI0025E07290|nr:hypothetical protein [uncultured Chryseobacterium sp.]